MSDNAHSYGIGGEFIYTNRGSSGYTGNDGKRCTIKRLKPESEWATDEPAYVIEFIGESRGFGVRESEIEPLTSAMQHPFF